jgi:hypothetical protein
MTIIDHCQHVAGGRGQLGRVRSLHTTYHIPSTHWLRPGSLLIGNREKRPACHALNLPMARSLGGWIYEPHVGKNPGIIEMDERPRQNVDFGDPPVLQESVKAGNFWGWRRHAVVWHVCAPFERAHTSRQRTAGRMRHPDSSTLRTGCSKSV